MTYILYHALFADAVGWYHIQILHGGDWGRHMTDGFYNPTIRLLGKKWTLQVLEEIGSQKRARFNQIKDKFEKITSSTLSSILKELEENDLIEKIIINKTPVRVDYVLTKSGKTLLNMLVPVLTWSDGKNLSYVDVAKLMVVHAIEDTLLEMGRPNLEKIQDILLQEYSCTIADCVGNPLYLKRVLQDLFGNAHTGILEKIQKKIDASLEINTKFSNAIKL
jgi:DNA-binding HxlR family transcriptional regulator